VESTSSVLGAIYGRWRGRRSNAVKKVGKDAVSFDPIDIMRVAIERRYQ
jgi:hypothetical protein